MFEVDYSCHQKYPKEFKGLFEKRVCQDSKAMVDYLHFGWLDFIDEYHKIVKKFPYSIYGIITFLKAKNEDIILELGQLEVLYKQYKIRSTEMFELARNEAYKGI